MADEPHDDDALELTTDMEADEDTEQAQAAPAVEEVEIAFEGEEAATGGEAEPDNATIRRMRDELREVKREAAELRKQNAPKPIEVGPRPALADFEYDEDAHAEAVEAWTERKRAVEQQQSAAEQEREQAQREWEQDLTAYQAKKGALGVADFDEVEGRVKDVLSLAQQSVLVKAANDPAVFLYAVGRSEPKMAELAKIKDPFKFAAAVARMEGSIKMTRRSAPKPDVPARGSGAMPGGADKQIEKLEKEAERTGDRTELVRYKASLKAKK